jgi:hypothetical protein
MFNIYSRSIFTAKSGRVMIRLWVLLLAVAIGAIGWQLRMRFSAAAQSVGRATAVSAASFLSPIAPEEIVSVFGANLASVSIQGDDTDPANLSKV